MDSKHSFGKELREIRELRHMSRRALARSADVDVSYIARLEVGERDGPSREVIVRLATALKVNPLRLLHAAHKLTDEELARYEKRPSLEELVAREPTLTTGQRDLLADFITTLRGYNVERTTAEDDSWDTDDSLAAWVD